MKKRWKGLCALWMVLALVIGAFPVAGASEDVPESAAAAVSEAAKEDGRQIPEESEESTMAESSVEKEEATESSVGKEATIESSTEREEAAEDSGEDKRNGDPELNTESEETDEGIEVADGTEDGTKDGTEKSETERAAAGISESASEESERASEPESEKLEEGAALTVLDLLEDAALSVKEAVTGEAAVSAEAWLYVGSDEVEAGSYVGDAEGAASYRTQVTVQFNEAFNRQDAMMNITVPQDKRLSGWRLWGFNDSGFVGGSSLGELEVTGQISADDYQGFNIDNSASFLLIVPLWRDAKAILNGDSLTMNMGDSCDLSEGTWQVDGDDTVYTGGRTVYAARSGTFTFHKKE